MFQQPGWLRSATRSWIAASSVSGRTGHGVGVVCLSANGVLAAMSSPLPGRPGDAVIIQERSKLARRWAHVLISAAVMPVMYAQFERRLLDLVADLCGAVVAEQHEPGYAAGARLVDMQCTGPATLQVSTDVIGRGLLDLSELRGLDRLTE